MFRPVLGALFGAAALGLALPAGGAGGGVTITSYGHSALLIQGGGSSVLPLVKMLKIYIEPQ